MSHDESAPPSGLPPAAEEIEVAADEVLRRLSSRADTVLNAILETRPSL